MTDILGYARVSTQQQDLDSQRHRLKKAGAIKIFEDVISGRIFERLGLEELIAYARPNDLLCIVRLDRLGCSLKESLETVEYLKKNKIGLMSLEEKIDTSSAAGELVFHVLGAIAHFERRLISERTKEGINAARLKGKTPRRPNLDKEKLDAALRLIKTGISPTNAAKQLQMGRSTIYRELKYTQQGYR
ncbi:MAG: recombinase family protein [Rickettsiaceae bacterium]|nr:recombinase family protein [Rickettsiaceae bacterium]MDD9336855.1 recombinase family protein [Rickettsiaceae bacterium]